jgi:hypothetical protein
MKTKNRTRKRSSEVSKRAVVTCLLTASAMMLGGCSDSVPQAKETPDSGQAPTSTSAPDKEAEAYADGFLPPSAEALQSDEDLADRTKISSCKSLKGGGALAQGTIKTQEEKPVQFEVTVFFKEEGKGGKYVGWATTGVFAHGMGETPWAAQKKFSSSGKLSCEVRAVHEVARADS